MDLPGTYSLTAHSIEEVVARDFIINEHPDVVVDIVDAGNFERNLYLTTQIYELNVPMVLALNMADMAEKQGITFDYEKIGKYFNASVVSTVGSKSKGIDLLLEAIIEKAENLKFLISHLRCITAMILKRNYAEFHAYLRPSILLLKNTGHAGLD